MTLIDKAKAIYEAYPRKAARRPAIDKILLALRQVPFEHLLERTKAFALAVQGCDPQYIPYPKTWFFQERWDDDPAEWSRIGRQSLQDARGDVFNPRTTQESVWSLKTRKEALEKQMATLAFRSRHEGPLGVEWSNREDRAEYIRLREAVKAIDKQIGGL